MAVVGWVNTETDLEDWADRPDEPALSRYLTAAHRQCLDFLPYTTATVDGVTTETTVVPDPVPANFVLAQIMQARALYRSVLSGSGDAIGADGMAVTVFPMDWTVKNLLRPRRVGRVL